MAQTIYEKRAFDHMPILADALEEAGCRNQGILGHYRSGDEHVRGCWVVDLLLGKGESLDAARKNGWTVVNMKKSWKQVFSISK
jgi:hypothetical protein